MLAGGENTRLGLSVGARWSRGATGPGGGRDDGADRRGGKREEITAMTAETTRQHIFKGFLRWLSR